MKINISKNENGLTIKEYFEREGFSARLITKIKNLEKGIVVNGERKTVRYTLVTGDELEIITEDTTSSSVPLSSIPIKVLYEDEWYIAVDKAPGLPIHPSRSHIDDTLASGVMSYFSGKHFVFRALTRLDRDTSGIVVIAKSSVSASRFASLLEKREVEKEYLALCSGVFNEKSGVIDFNIRRPSMENIMREAVEKGENKGENTPEGSTAITNFKVLRESDKASLVLFSIVTGRTHQIRVHASKIGHAVIGDTLYGEESEHISRQALHAHRLSFIHPFTKEKTEIISPLPEDIASAERMLFE